MAKKRTMLYFGSFNPPHLGHTAIAEHVLRSGLCDMAVMIVSPQNPHKQASELAPEMDRLNMTEAACAASAFPDALQASAVEFLLPRPSYTIRTLGFLEQNCPDMEFSILTGGDQRIDTWKDWQSIVSRYDIYVYPRPEAENRLLSERMHLLENAPQTPAASTDIRAALLAGRSVSEMLCPEVERYIREHGLWRPDAERLCEMGRELYRRGEFHRARNCMNDVLSMQPGHTAAKQYLTLLDQIFSFRYTDIYNP